MFLLEILENVLAIRILSKIVIFFTFKVPEISILSKTLSLLFINSVFNTSASILSYFFRPRNNIETLTIIIFLFPEMFLNHQNTYDHTVTVTRKSPTPNTVTAYTGIDHLLTLTLFRLPKVSW